jgi:hypothetical protein
LALTAPKYPLTRAPHPFISVALRNGGSKLPVARSCPSGEWALAALSPTVPPIGTERARKTVVAVSIQGTHIVYHRGRTQTATRRCCCQRTAGFVILLSTDLRPVRARGSIAAHVRSWEPSGRHLLPSSFSDFGDRKPLSWPWLRRVNHVSNAAPTHPLSVSWGCEDALRDQS